MNLTVWISSRLRIGGASGSRLGAGVAVAGIALAVIILEFTMAVVVGFKDGIRDKLIGFDAQVSVLPPLNPSPDTEEAQFVTLDPSLARTIERALPQAQMRLSLRQPGLLKTDNDFQGLVYLGQSAEADFTFEKSNIIEGQWPDFAADSCDNMIVISQSTASALNLHTDDKVFSTFFVDGDVKMRRHTIAGLYRSNFGEYDKTIVYASLRGLQRVAGIDSLSGSQIDLRGFKTDDIEASSDILQYALVSAVADNELDRYHPVTDVTRTGALYFNWLSLLNTNVVIIFILMLCVAGLTLVSSLFILILEHVSTIGILRTMGASKGTIRHIFIDMAMRLVCAGMVIGNIIGLGMLLIQKHTHILHLDPEMYYLDAVPVQINVPAIIILNIGIAATAWLIMVLPARLASGIDPAKTISYD